MLGYQFPYSKETRNFSEENRENDFQSREFSGENRKDNRQNRNFILIQNQGSLVTSHYLADRIDVIPGASGNGRFATYFIPKFLYCAPKGSMPTGDNNRKLSGGTAAQGGARAKQLASTPTAREAEISSAIQQLWMKLQMAGGYNPAAADHGRSSARIALIAVLEFLAVLFPDTPTLPLALQDLLQALVDLDGGTPNPLFERSKARGRAPIALGEDLFRAIVAAVMTKRMEAKDIGRQQAARDIARRLGELGYRPGRIQHGQIEDWRDKMREGDTASLAVQRYRLALELVEPMGPIEGAKFLLGNLPSLYPANFPKSRPA